VPNLTPRMNQPIRELMQTFEFTALCLERIEEMT
jgi:hypothetical protein